jgi:hypothetical protein
VVLCYVAAGCGCGEDHPFLLKSSLDACLSPVTHTSQLGRTVTANVAYRSVEEYVPNIAPLATTTPPLCGLADFHRSRPFCSSLVGASRPIVRFHPHTLPFPTVCHFSSSQFLLPLQTFAHAAHPCEGDRVVGGAFGAVLPRGESAATVALGAGTP